MLQKPNELPTEEELQESILKAKASGITSSNMKTTDSGAQMVLHYLPERFHSLSRDYIRQQVQRLSKAGKEPGDRKQNISEDDRLRNLCRRIIGLSKELRSDYHSDEYHATHSSEEFKTLRDNRKRALDYRCQLCCRHLLGSDLEGHILDYDHWNEPGMMLILCRDHCHPIADAIRRSGLASEYESTGCSLFGE